MTILPTISMIIWIGMTILEKFAHNFTNLTRENARAQYLNARLMINVLKNDIVLLFTYLWKDIQIALGYHDSLGVWFTCLPSTYFWFNGVLYR